MPSRRRRNSSLCVWAGLLIVWGLTIAAVNMRWQHLFQALRLQPAPSTSPASASAKTPAWHRPEPHHLNQRYWMHELHGVLRTTQSTFWNGTCWPDTIQWIGAVLNTLVAASDRTLVRRSTQMVDQTAPLNPTTDVERYLGHVHSYLHGEDVDQIFDAAYDDAQWVVLEWLEAIQLMREFPSSHARDRISEYAHRAHIFYNIVQDQFNTSQCGGGVTWNPELETYKNAITNELFLSASMAMYLDFPGDGNADPYPSEAYRNASSHNRTLPDLPSLDMHDPRLLQNAVQEYEWFATHNFTNAQGLVVDGFHLSPHQSTCDKRNEMVYTYNQAVLLSGLRGLWEVTGTSSYLMEGYRMVEAVMNATGWSAETRAAAGEWAGLGRNGILEDYCDARGNCGQDNLIFKGVYFHHLHAFCSPLPTKMPSVEHRTHLASAATAKRHGEKCASYLYWVLHNAAAALSTRTDDGLIALWWGTSDPDKSRASAPPSVKLPSGAIDVRNLEGPGSASTTKHRTRRTVETQGSGVAVVRAAADFVRWFDAGWEEKVVVRNAREDT